MFNDDHERSKRYIVYGKEKIFRSTGKYTVEWEGLDKINPLEWTEVLPADEILEYVFKRPFPEIGVQTTIEKGFYSYEWQIGYQRYQSTIVDMGVVNKDFIGSPEWTNQSIWVIDSKPAITRLRFRACFVTNC